MSCCGEPKTKNDDQNRPVSQYNPAFVSQQPGPTPDLSPKTPYFQQPIASPPPVHYQNGYQPQQGWDWRPTSPPISMINGGGSPRPPSIMNGSYSMNDSIRNRQSGSGMQPSPYSPSLSPGSPPPMSTSPVGRMEAISPPIDEGKMSVSIDFGT